jgi:hypothetical protein
MTTTRSASRNGSDSRSESRGKKPVHEIRMGRIKAAIWENSTDNGVRHNVTVTRLYKDGDAWKDSTSFGRDDLPLVAKVVDKAHSWIYRESTTSVEAS